MNASGSVKNIQSGISETVKDEMKFTTINGYRKTNYRRTNASVPVLVQGLLNDVLDGMLTAVDKRFERCVELGDG